MAACSGQRVAFWPLALLSAWSVIYELAFTVFPTLLGTVVYRGIAPDMVFLIAAALLIWRGFRGERGWMVIGVGALGWASGDIYWTLVLGNLPTRRCPPWRMPDTCRSARWRSSGSCRSSDSG